MTEYICYDCDSNEDSIGTCKLSLPLVCGKPEYCPILNVKCKWIQQ